jgi:hypothetical protein
MVAALFSPRRAETAKDGFRAYPLGDHSVTGSWPSSRQQKRRPKAAL